MKRLKTMFFLVAGCWFQCSVAYATATTHIWAPSTDVQAFKTGHITADVYIPTGLNSDGTRPQAITNTGLTVGILPFKKLNAEIGFDYKTGYGDLDGYPIYFNAKIAIPENSYTNYFPAMAFGIYDIGTKADKTDDNLWYGELAKTFSLRNISFGGLNSDVSLGRFSLGYFLGNEKLLLNEDGGRNNYGFLLAWERTMTELSDKLWICAEYQGTRSLYGAFNLGGSWKFSPNTSVIVGYQFYNNHNLADTATIQLDIDF